MGARRDALRAWVNGSPTKGQTRRADDRRTQANNEGSRNAQFSTGWASATNPESAAVAKYHEREWGRP